MHGTKHCGCDRISGDDSYEYCDGCIAEVGRMGMGAWELNGKPTATTSLSRSINQR